MVLSAYGEDNTQETHVENTAEQVETNTFLPARAVARRALFAKGLVLGASVIGLNLLEGNSSASAATVSTSEPLYPASFTQSTTRLQICSRATNGMLYHTVRYPNGSWQHSFGNINDQESNGKFLRFTEADCSGIGDSLHVAAIENNGIIYHTVRYPNGTWSSSFGNVNDQESNGKALRFDNIGCAGTTSNKLHLTAVANSGILYHTLRFSNGSWSSSFGNVNNQESNGHSLRFIDVDCATVGEDLHVCAIDRTGIIYHTIRHANGSWSSSFGNVNNQESNGHSLRFTMVGCTSIGNDLHVCAVERDGIIYHTIRHANGSWSSSFGNVNNQESNGHSLRFHDVTCTNVANTLHVAALNRSQVLWHTIRYANGSWSSSFGNVNNQESNGHSLRFTSLGTAGVV